jgi:hypothetical protein
MRMPSLPSRFVTCVALGLLAGCGGSEITGPISTDGGGGSRVDAEATPDHTVGTGGAGGSIAHDSGSHDATGTDEVAMVPDAGSDREEPTGSDASDDVTLGTGGCVPLTDGSGFLTFKASGGIDLDLHLGNLDSCNGYWTQTGGVGIVYFIPVPVTPQSSNDKAILSVDASGVSKGMTATGRSALFSVTGGGSIWSSQDLCKVDITTNELVGNGSTYKVGGSVHCTAPVPGIGQAKPLTVSQFDFLIAAPSQ